MCELQSLPRFCLWPGAVRGVLKVGSPPKPVPAPSSAGARPTHRLWSALRTARTSSTSKCFLFETQKCKIAEISNVSRPATILPPCTKDLMINVHTCKNTVRITMYSTCAKCMAFKHDTELISGVQTANTKASWFSFKKQHKGNT